MSLSELVEFRLKIVNKLNTLYRPLDIIYGNKKLVAKETTNDKLKHRNHLKNKYGFDKGKDIKQRDFVKRGQIEFRSEENDNISGDEEDATDIPDPAIDDEENEKFIRDIINNKIEEITTDKRTDEEKIQDFVDKNKNKINAVFKILGMGTLNYKDINSLIKIVNSLPSGKTLAETFFINSLNDKNLVNLIEQKIRKLNIILEDDDSSSEESSVDSTEESDDEDNYIDPDGDEEKEDY